MRWGCCLRKRERRKCMQPGEEGVNCQSKCSCARGNTAENVCDRRVSSGNSHKFADFRRFRKKLSKTPCIFPEMWYNRFRSEARAKRNRVEDVWGISAVGSAFEWHSKGQGFDSPMLHQKTLDFIRKIKGFIFSIARKNHWKSLKIESRNVQNNVLSCT